MSRNHKSFFTYRAEQFYRFLMGLSGRELSREELEKSAIVFAPHPDDETLGCGGTLIRKIQAGAPVEIVIVTDGCRSHDKFISEDELWKMRTQEMLAAAGKLGVGEEHVTFLGFKNGKLSENPEAVLDKIQQVLFRFQPQQVFIPCHLEPLYEHLLTGQIVKMALRASRLRPVIYEYPIWFWMHWPWVGPGMDGERSLPEKVKNTIFSWFGFRLVKEFRCSVYIGDVLDLKQTALAEHKSQMTRINGLAQWPVLRDVGGGQFLDCFFQNREVFHQYRFW